MLALARFDFYRPSHKEPEINYYGWENNMHSLYKTKPKVTTTLTMLLKKQPPVLPFSQENLRSYPLILPTGLQRLFGEILNSTHAIAKF